MTDSLYFDRQGNPITPGTWSRLLADFEYRQVAADAAGQFWVSTVWLGLNHDFFMHHAPMIFETMVFPGKQDEEGIASFREVFGPWRYSSEQEARRWHQAIVGKLRELSEKKLTAADMRALIDDLEVEHG